MTCALLHPLEKTFQLSPVVFARDALGYLSKRILNQQNAIDPSQHLLRRFRKPPPLARSFPQSTECATVNNVLGPVFAWDLIDNLQTLDVVRGSGNHLISGMRVGAWGRDSLLGLLIAESLMEEIKHSFVSRVSRSSEQPRRPHSSVSERQSQSKAMLRHSQLSLSWRDLSWPGFFYRSQNSLNPAARKPDYLEPSHIAAKARSQRSSSASNRASSSHRSAGSGKGPSS